MLEGMLMREQAALLQLETSGQQLDFSVASGELETRATRAAAAAARERGRFESALDSGGAEMLYDPVLNAFYDPAEGKFYRLK
jgi:hypothetical protein